MLCWKKEKTGKSGPNSHGKCGSGKILRKRLSSPASESSWMKSHRMLMKVHTSIAGPSLQTPDGDLPPRVASCMQNFVKRWPLHSLALPKGIKLCNLVCPVGPCTGTLQPQLSMQRLTYGSAQTWVLCSAAVATVFLVKQTWYRRGHPTCYLPLQAFQRCCVSTPT